MRPIPLVRGWALLPLVEFLRSGGAPVYRWLEASGIPAQSLDAPHLPLPLPRVLDFAHRAARAEGAETLGLDVGRRVAAESYGTWGQLLVGTPTIHDRIRKSIELMSLHQTGFEMWLEVGGSLARLCFRYADGLGPGLVHAEDNTLVVSLEVFRRAMGDDWRPLELVLPRPRPERFRRDEMFRDVKLVHTGQTNQIVFPAELLSRPLPTLPTPVGREESRQEFFRHLPATDIAGSIQDTVAALLPAGYPPVEEMADIAGTSVRTLQRELACVGLSYSKVVELARLGLAKDYLRDPSASVTEIGLQLGYGDGTAFSRAFHRWSGMSPSQFRHALGDDDPGRSSTSALSRLAVARR